MYVKSLSEITDTRVLNERIIGPTPASGLTKLVPRSSTVDGVNMHPVRLTIWSPFDAPVKLSIRYTTVDIMIEIGTEQYECKREMEMGETVLEFGCR